MVCHLLKCCIRDPTCLKLCILITPLKPGLGLWRRRLMHLQPEALRRTLEHMGVDPQAVGGSLEFCDPCWSAKFDRRKAQRRSPVKDGANLAV